MSLDTLGDGLRIAAGSMVVGVSAAASARRPVVAGPTLAAGWVVLGMLEYPVASAAGVSLSGPTHAAVGLSMVLAALYAMLRGVPILATGLHTEEVVTGAARRRVEDAEREHGIEEPTRDDMRQWRAAVREYRHGGLAAQAPAEAGVIVYTVADDLRVIISRGVQGLAVFGGTEEQMMGTHLLDDWQIDAEEEAHFRAVLAGGAPRAWLSFGQRGLWWVHTRGARIESGEMVAITTCHHIDLTPSIVATLRRATNA